MDRAKTRAGDGANAKYDLTSGGIVSRLLAVILPLVGTNLLQMSYSLVDVFMLGRAGSDAVAAAGSAGMYIWLAGGLMLLGRIGAEIGVSQELGAGERGAALEYARAALFVAAAAGLVTAAAFTLAPGALISIFGLREAHVARDAASYLFIVGPAMPFAFVGAAAGGVFNGSGNSRSPFAVNAAGLVLNAVLDPLMIFGLGMGVRGAAAATAIAQIASASVMLRLLARGRGRPFESFPFLAAPSASRAAVILRSTMPVCVENSLFCLFTMIVSRIVASFGAGAMAVYRAGCMIESVCWLVCTGAATAVTAFVGQNFGAGRWDRVRAGVWAAYALLGGWGAACGLLLLLAGGPIFSFFLPDPALAEMGRDFLWIIAWGEALTGIEAASHGAFRGLGVTWKPSVAATIGHTSRIPLAILLSDLPVYAAWLGGPPLGVHGVWIAIALSASIRGLIIAPWLFSTMRRMEDQPSGAS